MSLSQRGHWMLTGLLLVAVIGLGGYAFALHSQTESTRRQLDTQSARVDTREEVRAASEEAVAQKLANLMDAVTALRSDWATATASQTEVLTTTLKTREDQEKSLLEKVALARAQLDSMQAQVTAADLPALQDDLARKALELRTLSDALDRLRAEAAALDKALAEATFDPAALFEQAKDSVVTVYIDGTGVGAGFVVGSERRYVVTAYHMLEAVNPPGNIQISVQTSDGFRTRAEFARLATQQDLVLLVLDMPLYQVAPFKLADPTSIAVGQRVMAIGNPLQFQWAASTGVIARLNPIPKGIFQDTPCEKCPNLIQFDAVIAPGSSGGPLLNTRGEVVGMVSFGASSDEVNFAIPSNLIRTLINSIVKE